MPNERKLSKAHAGSVDRDVLVTFGARLKALRVARKMSQSELALRCEMDRSYVSGLECGKRNPTLKVLEKLAYKLDVNLAQLLTLKSPRK